MRDAPAIEPVLPNSVDATTGSPLVERVQARKLELEELLVSLPVEDQHTHTEIQQALSGITPLLTGDLEHVPAVVAADMNRWLERTKHVAETAIVPSTAPPAVIPPTIP